MAEHRGAGRPQPGAGQKKSLRECLQEIERGPACLGIQQNGFACHLWTWLHFRMRVQYQGTELYFN